MNNWNLNNIFFPNCGLQNFGFPTAPATSSGAPPTPRKIGRPAKISPTCKTEDEQEREKLRRERNRLSAERCRQRKVKKEQDLMEEVEKEQRRNLHVQQAIFEGKERIRVLTLELNKLGGSVPKEIEEIMNQRNEQQNIDDSTDSSSDIEEICSKKYVQSSGDMLNVENNSQPALPQIHFSPPLQEEKLKKPIPEHLVRNRNMTIEGNLEPVHPSYFPLKGNIKSEFEEKSAVLPIVEVSPSNVHMNHPRTSEIPPNNSVNPLAPDGFGFWNMPPFPPFQQMPYHPNFHSVPPMAPQFGQTGMHFEVNHNPEVAKQEIHKIDTKISAAQKASGSSIKDSDANTLTPPAILQQLPQENCNFGINFNENPAFFDPYGFPAEQYPMFRWNQ